MGRCKRICIASKRSEQASDNIQRPRIISRIFSHLGHPSAKDILSRNAYRFTIVFITVQRGKHFWENGMNQGKLERRPVVIVTAWWKRENTKCSSRRLEQWRDKKSIQIQLVPSYCNNTWLDTKPFAIIRNKEIGQDQQCQHTFAHLPLCAGQDVYPTTDSLDDLDASRTGIHHHVMYTTPSHPCMLSHMNWFPCYRFWDFTISFYISGCIFLYDKSLENILPTRRVLPLSHMFHKVFCL